MTHTKSQSPLIWIILFLLGMSFVALFSIAQRNANILEPNAWILPFLTVLVALLVIIAIILAWNIDQHNSTSEASPPQKKAQQHSEDRYRIISDLLADYAYAFAVNERGELQLEWVVGGFERITGFSPEESEEQGGWGKLIHPDDLPLAVARGKRLLSGKQDITVLRIKRADGEIRWLQDYGQPVWDENAGRVIRIYGATEDITKRKEAEEAQRQSDEKFRILYNNSPDMYVSVLPEDASILECNETLLTKTGYSREEVIGSPIFNMYHEDCMDNVKEAFAQFVNTGIVQDKELTLKKKDGSKLEVSLNVTAVKDNSGKIIHSMSSWRDITKRKQAESLTLKNRNRLAYALRSIDTGAWELDLQKKDAWRSLQHDQIFGYKTLLPKWTFDMFMEHVIPEDRAAVNEKFQHAIVTKTDWNFECRIKRVDNVIRWIWAKGRQEFVEDEGSEKMFGVVQDITERKNAENELNKQREMFEAVINSIPSRIFWKDLNSVYLGCNPAFAKAAGEEKPDDVIGKNDFDLIWAEEAAKFINDDEQVMRTGQPKLGYDEFYRRPDGNKSWWHTSKTPLKDSDGNIFGILCASEDFTKRIQAEEELVRAHDLLEEAQKIAQLGIFEYVTATQTTVWSEQEHRIYGLDPDGPSPTYDVMLRDCIHPEDSDLLHQTFMQAMQSQSVYELEHRIVWPDGTVRWVHDRALPYFDEQGHLIRYLGVTLDITKRKQANQALRLSEKLLREAQEIAHIAHWTFDPVSGMHWWSEELYKIYDRDPANGPLPYSEHPKLVHPDDWGWFDTTVQNTAETGAPFDIVLRILRPDGSVRYINSICKPLTDDTGAVLEMRGTIQDVTDRKLAEVKLRASEKRFRALFEQAGDYCMILDPNTEDGIPIIVDANKAAYELHGYTREEFIGRPVADIDDDEGKKLVIKHTNMIMTGKPFLIENTHIRKDGSTFPVSVHANRIDIEGEPPLIFTTEFDISERVQAEENYKNLFEHMLNGVALYKIITDTNGDTVNLEYISANHVFGQHTNLSVDEIIGKSISEVVTDIRQKSPDLIEIYSNIASSGESHQFEVYYEDTNRWFSISAYSPQEGYVATISEDITAQKKFIELLKENEEILKVAQEAGHIGTWRYNISNGMWTLSDEFLRIFGMSKNICHLDKILNFIFADDKTLFDEALQKAKKAENEINVQHRIIREDNSEMRWIHSRGKVVTYEAGNQRFITGAAQDITERMETALELEEYRTSLEKKVRERTDKLNTIITAMSGREVRMAELKRVIKKLRKQLLDADMTPVANDPLLGDS